MKKYIELAVIFCISIFIMLAMQGFHANLFFVDDNYAAFYPIMQESFDTLTKTGRLPIYNFFQMKGLIISDQGYYGQINGLLFLSYFISRFLVPHWNLCSVYSVLCVALGNCILYILLNRLGGGKKNISCLCIFMLSCSSAFFSYGYWFYVWGNYLVVPALMLALYSCFYERNRITYMLSGMILFFSLSLGNIQYTFFHYMIFCISYVVFIAISKEYKEIKRLASNLLIGVLLSSPFLLLQLKAAARRGAYTGGSQFLTFPNSLDRWLYLSAAPFRWIQTFFKESIQVQDFLYKDSFVSFGYDYFYCGFLFLSLLFYIAYHFWKIYKQDIYGLGKNSWKRYIYYKIASFCTLLYVLHDSVKCFYLLCFLSILEICLYSLQNKTVMPENMGNRKPNQEFYTAIFFSIAFFIILGMGEGYFIADFLSQLPVIKEFRHLFKTVFVILPMLPVLSVFMLSEAGKKYKRFMLIVCTIWICIGLYNNFDMATSNTHRVYKTGSLDHDLLKAKDTINERCLELNIDKNNYRFCPFLENDNGTDYWSYFGDAFYHIETKFTCNMASLAKVYTLGGYDLASMEEGYRQSNHLLDGDFCYDLANGIYSYQFFERCSNEEGFINRAVDEILQNHVKYFIFTENSGYLEEFKNVILNDSRVGISRIVPFLEQTVLVELDGVARFCGDTLDLKFIDSDLDRLVIDVKQMEENQELEIPFTYYPDIKAYGSSGDSTYPLGVSETENGYIRITAPMDFESGQIEVVYSDYLRSFILIYMLAASSIALVFIGFIITFQFRKDNFDQRE